MKERKSAPDVSEVTANGNTPYDEEIINSDVDRIVYHNAFSKDQSGAGGTFAGVQSILDVNFFETFSSDFTDMDVLKNWTK